MKKLNIFTLITLAFILSSCLDSKPPVAKEIAIGKILSCQFFPSTFLQRGILQITTEKRIVFTRGVSMVPLDTQAFLKIYDNGYHFIYWEGSDKIFRVY